MDIARPALAAARRLRRLSVALLVFTATASCADGNGAQAQGERERRPAECDALAKTAGSDADASPLIAQCLLKLPQGAVLDLTPGRYHLRTPLVIARPVAIRTGAVHSAGACRNGRDRECATLVIDRMTPQPGPGIMPIEITAANVRLQSIAVVGGTDRNDDWKKQVCLDERIRPLGGGIRVKGSDFRMEDVLLRNVSCSTAMEITSGALRPVIKNNSIGPNGHHGGQMWADGLTIHDTSGAVIANNLFIDNTDVQLVLGGCVGCTIEANVFRHSPSLSQASFAELMLHAWPNTSGDFQGSTTSRNDIDCGAARRCGFGIMIGGEPWYPANTSGGTVTLNRITNALLGMNVDRLTGRMTISNNEVTNSGGSYPSSCGPRIWPSVNVSPRSKPFVSGDLKNYRSMDTTKCLILR